MHGPGDGGHRTQAGSPCRHRRSRLHDAWPGAGHRGGGRQAMSKSKRRVEAIPNPEAEAVDLPEAWKKRPWVPFLIMGTLIAVVLTSGQIVIELLPDTAPVTVNNFVVLALDGYYTGSLFWKAEDWVVQAGDPKGDGTGGPGYNLPEEPNTFLKWDLGSVGMARVPGGPINGSQFFITKAAWPGAGPTATYNRFGTVVSGMEKVQAVTPSDKIISITILVT